MSTKQGLAQSWGRIVPVWQHQTQAGRRATTRLSFRNQVSGQSQGDPLGAQGKPVPGSAIMMPINEVRAELWQGRAEAADAPG